MTTFELKRIFEKIEAQLSRAEYLTDLIDINLSLKDQKAA